MSDDRLRLALSVAASTLDDRVLRHSIEVFKLSAGLSENQRLAAILHDVCEDSSVEIADLDRLFGPRVAAIVDALTRREGETYRAYLDRLSLCAPARAVKRRDLWENLRHRPVPGDLERRYVRAMSLLYAREEKAPGGCPGRRASKPERDEGVRVSSRRL